VPRAVNCKMKREQLQGCSSFIPQIKICLFKRKIYVFILLLKQNYKDEIIVKEGSVRMGNVLKINIRSSRILEKLKRSIL